MAVVYWSARLAVNEEVRVRSPPVTPIASTESADEWSSTGPENRGGGDEPQRFDSSALVSRRPVRLSARLPLFQGGEAGAAPARATACRVRLVRPRTLPPQGGNAGSNPARDANPPGKWTAARTTNPGSGVRIASGGRHWRRAGVVTGRFAKPWPTTVARVRFAPSPLRSFVRSAGPK